MDYITDLKNFIPSCEQEKIDYKLFLEFINTYKDKSLDRDNLIGHLSSSAWIVNQDKTKVLFNFHNIYKNWGWLGGHSDGEKDQSKVALKEAKEESGIDDIKLLSSSPISIEILPVSYHIKNDKFVNSHLHFNMTYLLQANDTSELKIKPDENSGLKWVDLDDAYKYTNEECMIPIYKKLSQYVKKIKD
ncbi:MAG: NUDIX hydrolase [Anaeroplasma sp.]|nr:NUDIX hydrolase [Anaeroplasma sp.]